MNSPAIDATIRQKSRVVLITVLLSLAIGPQQASGQQAASLRSDVPFTDHVHRLFRDREGLPSNWIYDILQTRDGYMWIATHNGIARYDGLRFDIFHRSNTPQLPANDIRVLYESGDGSLWIGTIGGLVRFRPGRPGRFETFDIFAGNSVHAILEDSVGNLWIGTREATWVKEPSGDFELAQNAPADVKAICEDTDGTLWFGTDTGLYRRRGSTLERVSHPRLKMPAKEDRMSDVGINVLLPDGNGMWVGSGRGLLHIKGGSFTTKGKKLGVKRINDVSLTRDGGLYVATHIGLYRSVDGDSFVKLPSEARAQCLTEDGEGGLWVGHTNDRGLNYFRNSEVRRLLHEFRVNCVHEDAQGDLWFGSFSGLHRLHEGELSRFGVADGLPHENVQTIVQGTGNTLWIGTRQGLAKWSDDQLTAVVEPAELAQLNIATIFVDSENVLWLSLADKGGRTLDNGVLKPIRELEHGNIGWFHEDSSGELWIGHEYGLFRREDGRIQEFTDPALNQLNNRHFICKHAAIDGTLWLGTSGGIVRYHSDRFQTVTSEHGLAADYVDRIQEDRHGNLWFAGRDGFFYVDAEELHDVANGRLGSVVSHRLEPVEGVPVNRYHPKGCLARDGTLWIAAGRGVIRVPP